MVSLRASMKALILMSAVLLIGTGAAHAQFTGVTLVSMGFSDQGGAATDIAIDASQKICNPEEMDLEPFFQTELHAVFENFSPLNVAVTKISYRARNPATKKLIWKSPKFSGSYTSIPPKGTGDLRSVVSTGVGPEKIFISSNVSLLDHLGPMNVTVRFTLRDTSGRRFRIRRSLLLVSAELDRC